MNGMIICQGGIRMKTWDEYKEQVKQIDSVAKEDIEEAEALSMIITEMIKQRKALGWSQRELAKMCEMPQSSIARIEAQITTPNISTLLRIFHKLGLRLSVTYK